GIGQRVLYSRPAQISELVAASRPYRINSGYGENEQNEIRNPLESKRKRHGPLLRRRGKITECSCSSALCDLRVRSLRQAIIIRKARVAKAQMPIAPKNPAASVML